MGLRRRLDDAQQELQGAQQAQNELKPQATSVEAGAKEREGQMIEQLEEEHSAMAQLQ